MLPKLTRFAFADHQSPGTILIARYGAEMGEDMNFLEMDEGKILSIADPIMDNCLKGSNENNHAKHVKDFTERMRNIVKPENLKMQLSHEPRAFFTNRKFVHIFRWQSSSGVVWK